MDNTTERLLIIQIKQSNEQAFQKIYKNYYQRILMYSIRFLKEELMAEEIAQHLYVLTSTVNNHLVESLKRNAGILPEKWDYEHDPVFSEINLLSTYLFRVPKVADKGRDATENSWPFPIPQIEIDRSNGILIQNTNY